jgi:hypothetical protein
MQGTDRTTEGHALRVVYRATGDPPLQATDKATGDYIRKNISAKISENSS